VNPISVGVIFGIQSVDFRVFACIHKVKRRYPIVINLANAIPEASYHVHDKNQDED
jgi:hypothetical protein